MVSSGMLQISIGRYSHFAIEIHIWAFFLGMTFYQHVLYYLQKTIIRLRQYNNDILVALWVGPDIQDSDEHIVQVSVGVLNFQRHTFSKERLCKI